MSGGSTSSNAFLTRMAERVRGLAPWEAVETIEALVADHADWRRSVINLVASDNRMSDRARRMLATDLATRVTEGMPGDKEFPPPAHNMHVDQIEGVLIALLQHLTGARHIEWRPVSTTMANAIVLRALAAPGDRVLVQSLEGGANASYHRGAVPTVLTIEVDELAASLTYEILLDEAWAAARRAKPVAIVVGGSYVLFPYPIRELADIADAVGATLVYDGAHVASLIAGGFFQRPLVDGARVFTFGTHKSMGGPVGGVIATDDDALAASLHALTFPGFLQTRDLNKYAAAAIAMAEMVCFGADYARDMVDNARWLAGALERDGFQVIGASRGYTETHQVLLDARALDGHRVQTVSQACGILLHKARMQGDGPSMMTRSAVRLSTQEVTRQGMGREEMALIARWIGDAVWDRRPPTAIAADVAALAHRFPGCEYSFDAPLRIR